MSIKAMSWVWDNSPYDGVGLLVHLALADFADDNGYCWPSQKRIADKCKSSERHVRRIIAQMIDDGQLYIVVKSNGVTTNNKYQLVFNNMDRTPRPVYKVGQDIQNKPIGHFSPVGTGHLSPANHHITTNNHQKVTTIPKDFKEMIKKMGKEK